MPETVIYIDRSRIRPGKLEPLKQAIENLVEFIESREPQLLSYGFYLDEDAGRMTVVAVHPDTASVEYHMDVGASAFASFGEFIQMEAIEVYGDASDRMREQLQTKAETLGEHHRVSVQPLHAGFAREGAPASPDM